MLTPVKSSPGLPVPLSAALDAGLRRAVTRLDPPITPGETRYSIAACDMPSDEVRDALAVRRSRIDGWMQPAGPEMALAEFRMLVANMLGSNVDAEMADLETAGFVEATRRLPAFALSEACTAYRHGRHGKFLPKAPEVCDLATRIASSYAKERREIDALLTATVRPQPVDDDRKAKLLDIARSALRTMPLEGRRAEAARAGRVVDLSEDKAPVDHLAHAAELAKQPMPAMSAGLLDATKRKMGLPDREDAA